VPPLFFFNPARQAELDAARTDNKSHREPLDELIDSLMPLLVGSVEVRRAARAIAGLRETVIALLPTNPRVRDLADLLAVPDDEVVLLLDPARRTGYRMLIRGVADAGHFQELLAAALPRKASPAPSRQLFRPEALRPDGTLPDGFRGCEHWIWGSEPLAAVPRIDGERVILIGDSVVNTADEVERRFPGMVAEVRVVETLGPFVVAERLGRLAGQPVPVCTVQGTPIWEDVKAA
jgi:hypothetical protein